MNTAVTQEHSATSIGHANGGFSLGQYAICLKGIVWREGLGSYINESALFQRWYALSFGYSFLPPASVRCLAYQLFPLTRPTFFTPNTLLRA